MRSKSKGQIAYEAYSRAFWAPGAWRLWDDISKFQKEAFEAAAQAVLKSEKTESKK